MMNSTMTMWRAILCLMFAFLFFAACRSLPAPVLTEDRGGEALVKREIQRTGSRSDVPAGVKPRNVVATVKLKSGGEITIDKKDNYYLDKEAEKVVEDVVKPKAPWWKWPVIIFGFIGVALILFFLDKIKNILFFWKR